MFHPKPAIALMALAIICNRTPAQSLQAGGLMTSSAVAKPVLYAPLSNNFSPADLPESESSSIEPTERAASGLIRPVAHQDKKEIRPFSTVAIGFKADTLGGGVEVATPLSHNLNLRASVNVLHFAYAFNIDGISYDTAVRFNSGVMNVDWFPFHGGFHISPGVVYFKTGLAGGAAVPPGQSFSLSDTNYIDSVDDPVHGTASISYDRKIAPALTVGFTNIIPRNGGHFTMPFEIGAAYLGAAKMNIQLAGTACTNQGCFNAATNPEVQTSLQQEVQNLNGDLAKYKFYPLISLGFAFRF